MFKGRNFLHPNDITISSLRNESMRGSLHGQKFSSPRQSASKKNFHEIIDDKRPTAQFNALDLSSIQRPETTNYLRSKQYNLIDVVRDPVRINQPEIPFFKNLLSPRLMSRRKVQQNGFFCTNLLEKCRDQRQRNDSFEKSLNKIKSDPKIFMKDSHKHKNKCLRMGSFGESSLDYVGDLECQDNIIEVCPSLIEDFMDLQKASQRVYHEEATAPRLRHRKTQPVIKSLMQSSVKTSQIIEKTVTNEGQRKINQYTVTGELGRGSFGKVKMAQDEEGTKYAIKIIDRKKVKRRLITMKVDAHSMLEREIAIMKKVSHKNIVRLFEVMENPTDDKLYLVLEYMDFGSLLSTSFFKKTTVADIQILPDSENRFLERSQAREFFRQFCLGLDYRNVVHSYAHIVHRDIKPENLLVNKHNQLKISDFGVSQIMEDDYIKTAQKSGTMAYLPPEVFSGGVVKGKPLDIWASGITLFQMVYGVHPFYQGKADDLTKQIINSTIPFPELETDKQLMNLIKGMLEKDPVKRLTIQQIMVHPWVTRKGDEPLINDFDGQFEIGQEDLEKAIKILTVGMSFKTVWKLKQSLNRSRQRIKQKELSQLMDQVDSFSG